MPLPLLAGLGGAIGGIGSMVGGAVSGIGGALGSMGAFGSAATGGKAATAGLLGAGGKFGLGQAMMTGGMGLAALQAFSGGSSGGYAPSEKITLSPEGKKLQKTIFETVQKQYTTGLIPQNVASIYMGKVKKKEGEEHRIARGALSSLASRDVRGPQGVRAALTESGRRVSGLRAPTEQKIGRRIEERRGALTMMENLRNIEMQTPLLRAQSQLFGRGMGQLQSAARGQALGDIALMAAYMKYPPYRRR